MYNLAICLVLAATLCSGGPVVKREEHHNVYNRAIDGILAKVVEVSKKPVPDDWAVKNLALPFEFKFGFLQTTWNVWVTAAQPVLTIPAIKRLDDAVISHHDTNVTLTTTLGFGPANLVYRDFQASFWIWSISGSLTVNITSMGIAVNVTHRDKECSHGILNSHISSADYQIKTTSWMGWLINPLAQSALSHSGSFVATALKNEVENNILPSFSKTYCEKASCLEFWED